MNDGLLERREQLLGKAYRLFYDGLQELATYKHIIGDIRGSGLFFGIDLVRNRDSREPATAQANKVVNRLRRHGVLIGTTGRYDNILKIRPPLVFSKENADLLVQKLDEVL
jgi:4-aminobutyrate aminotransferase-like enzyme